MVRDFSHTFSWELLSDILLVCVVPGDIEAKRWQAYLATLRSGDVRLVFTLVKGAVTIDANMRKGAASALKEQDLPVFVVTDSRLTRGMLTAMSWLGAKFTAYGWDDLDTALVESGAAPDIEKSLRTAAVAFKQYASGVTD